MTKITLESFLLKNSKNGSEEENTFTLIRLCGKIVKIRKRKMCKIIRDKELIKVLKRILSEAQVGLLIILIIICYIVIALSNIVSTKGMGIFIEEVLTKGFIIDVLIFGLLIIAGGKLISALLEFFFGILQATIVKKATIKYNQKFAESYLNAEFEWIQKIEKGDLLTRIQSDLDAAVTAVAELIPLLLRSVLISSIIISIIFVLDYRSAIVLLIPVPFIFISQRIGGKLAE